MPHSLILGMTESGKSTLAKQLIKGYVAAGIKCCVLDPILDNDWNADYLTDDPDRFLYWWGHGESLAMFIDESSETCGQWDKEMIKTATRGRHYGHNMHYISHRGTGLSPTIRSNCTHLYLFKSDYKDCEIFKRDFCEPRILEAVELPQYHFLHASRYGPVKLGST